MQETGPVHRSHGAAPAGRIVRAACWTVGFTVLALILFRNVLPRDRLLLTTDDNLGQLTERASQLPGAFSGAWHATGLWGQGTVAIPSWTNLLLWLFPVEFFSNWIHAIDLLAASLFLVLFLRMRNLSPPACALGALTAFWLGSNFTLTYAGHIAKFAILAFAPAFLCAADLAARTGRSSWAVTAGGLLGLLFLEQIDVALFFSLFLGPYALFALWRERGWDGRAWARVVPPMLLMAFVVAFHPLWQGYQVTLGGGREAPRNAAEHWDFVTQWSWPPEESIDFIAPGFYGWRSGEPAGPYWGRMGRSAEWKQTGQGFMNFKLENQYLGAIPLSLAFFALWTVWRDRSKRSRRDVFFWSAAALLALLLSFGRFFPLYQYFYRLPVIHEIRNPNKFLQVFQLATGVLAAVGFSFLFRPPSADKREGGT